LLLRNYLINQDIAQLFPASDEPECRRFTGLYGEKSPQCDSISDLKNPPKIPKLVFSEARDQKLLLVCVTRELA
jgi:hypothetical protein